MEKIMPILKPAGYRKDVPYFIKEQLLNNNSSPVIAFGVDKGSHIEYEGAQDQESYEAKLKEMREEALHHLKSVEPKIEFQEVEGTKVAFISNNEYASEKIWDKDYMISLAEKLDAGDLMVGIPFKGHMLAVDSSSNLRNKFPAVIIKYFENPQQDTISPHVFLVRNGEVIAMAGVDVGDDNAATNVSLSENQETNNYVVKIKATTIDEVKEMVNSSYQQILLMVMKTKQFGGKIDFYIDGEIEKSEELVNRCNFFVEQISNNEMAQTIVSVIAKNGISPQFYYKNEKIAPLGSGEKKEEVAKGEEFVEESLTEEQKKEREVEQAENADYSNFTLEELDKVYYEIVSIPDARLHLPSLIKMTKLMEAYEKMGEKMPPDRRKGKSGTAKRPANWGKSKSESSSPPLPAGKNLVQKEKKKWWEFWK